MSTKNELKLQRIRRDSGQEGGTPIDYDSGSGLARWSGDEVAPYVKVFNDGNSPDEHVPTLPYALIHKEDPTEILSRRTLTGTYQSADIIDVSVWRTATLYCYFPMASAENKISILPLVSPFATKPTREQNRWFSPAVWDGSITAQTLSGTKNADAEYTTAPEWGTTILYPNEIQLSPADNSTDKILVKIPLVVTDDRWFTFDIADLDASGTLADARVWIQRSI